MIIVDIISFITSHLLEIIFSLIATGALAFCKHLYSQKKTYEKLVNEQKQGQLEETIENRIEPIKTEIEELRKYIRNVGAIEKSHMDLIISSYRFRLVQLCRELIKQGYLTQCQYDQLVEFYKLYHGLGGNGQAQEYYEKAIKLEIREEK